MFGRLWNLIKRHKKKLIFSGVLVWGGRYSYLYVRRRLQEFQEREATECLVHARRQHHFDSNQRTCNMTVLSMLPTLRERLVHLLDTEQLIEQLKGSPENKLQIWEELKTISITRVLAVVYGYTMMCVMLRVQLNIIGGYMYVENMSTDKPSRRSLAQHITPTDVQERYLSLIKEFFNKGLCDLVSVIQNAVVKETGSLSLKEKFSIQNIEAIVKHVRERIETGADDMSDELPTIPLSRLLLVTDSPVQSGQSAEGEHYSRLIKETQDILESSDFHEVFGLCLDRGFGKLLEYIEDFYKKTQKTDATATHFHDVAIPLAKLIPFLSGLLYKLGSDAPNPLVQELLLLEQTKTLAANIYEAFSQTDDVEDPQLAP